MNIPDKKDKKYQGFKVSSGAQLYIDDIQEQIAELKVKSEKSEWNNKLLKEENGKMKALLRIAENIKESTEKFYKSINKYT